MLDINIDIENPNWFQTQKVSTNSYLTDVMLETLIPDRNFPTKIFIFSKDSHKAELDSMLKPKAHIVIPFYFGSFIFIVYCFISII